MTLAEDLRAWRATKGLTREEAAERLGVNWRTLEGWEQGRREPPYLTLDWLLKHARSAPARSK